jgi:hypothetical protein
VNGLAVKLCALPGRVPDVSRQTNQIAEGGARTLSRVSGPSTNGRFGAGRDC